MSGYEARQIARDAIRFWDELAGIYVLNDGGDVLTSRTRLFAELADALWVDDLEDAQNISGSSGGRPTRPPSSRWA